jgi:hypothetical protein
VSLAICLSGLSLGDDMNSTSFDHHNGHATFHRRDPQNKGSTVSDRL